MNMVRAMVCSAVVCYWSIVYPGYLEILQWHCDKLMIFRSAGLATINDMVELTV